MRVHTVTKEQNKESLEADLRIDGAEGKFLVRGEGINRIRNRTGHSWPSIGKYNI